MQLALTNREVAAVWVFVWRGAVCGGEFHLSLELCKPAGRQRQLTPALTHFQTSSDYPIHTASPDKTLYQVVNHLLPAPQTYSRLLSLVCGSNPGWLKWCQCGIQPRHECSETLLKIPVSWNRQQCKKPAVQLYKAG